MSEYLHKSHNVRVLLYHLVFPAKNRRAIFDGKINWRIQLNVRNVFADSDPLVVLRQPDGSVGRVSIPVPRVYQISNTFSF